jgi:CRISPR-associated protein Csc2
MSRQGELTNRINEQDHVRPQTLFPSVITIRDLSAPLFSYVLMNVLRARRYGAQTTRTGTMTNHLIGIVLADGEIFSNLHFTQRLYDGLNAGGHISEVEPIPVDKALDSARTLVPQLLEEDRVMRAQTLMGDELDTFLNTLGRQMRDEQGMRTLLQAAADASRAYHARYVQKKGKK